MKLIDLTHTFVAPMPVYPGDPEPEFLALSSLKHDGVLNTQLSSGLHVGTHIDAPAHMIAGGKQLSDYHLERFIGRGVLVDARGKQSIGADLLRNVELNPGDMVLVMTNWSQFYHDSKYFADFPVLEEAFANRLIEAGISFVGSDTSSPDEVMSDDDSADDDKSGFYPIHHQLLGADILIGENLNHLSQLANVPEFEVIALPAKFAADGAPARIIASIR